MGGRYGGRGAVRRASQVLQGQRGDTCVCVSSEGAKRGGARRAPAGARKYAGRGRARGEKGGWRGGEGGGGCPCVGTGGGRAGSWGRLVLAPPGSPAAQRGPPRALGARRAGRGPGGAARRLPGGRRAGRAPPSSCASECTRRGRRGARPWRGRTWTACSWPPQSARPQSAAEGAGRGRAAGRPVRRLCRASEPASWSARPH